eukprot:Clim_evm17s197 gene=Clim_evmTU17s197
MSTAAIVDALLFGRVAKQVPKVVQDIVTGTARITTLQEWKQVYQSRICPEISLSILRSLVAGYASDRMAWVFSSGYQGALIWHLRARIPEETQLLKSLETKIMCFSVNEKDVKNPKTMGTVLTAQGDGFFINGSKSWVTLGEMCEVMLIAAGYGDASPDGKRKLKLCVVPTADATGITLNLKKPTPFTPEMPHSAAVLENVSVPSAMVFPPGDKDGYESYVRCFGPAEDVHVMMALTGYWLSIANGPLKGSVDATMRAGWISELGCAVSMAQCLTDVANGVDADSNAGRLILHTLCERVVKVRSAIAEELKKVDKEWYEREKRDEPLVLLPAKMRKARFESLAAKL